MRFSLSPNVSKRVEGGSRRYDKRLSTRFSLILIAIFAVITIPVFVILAQMTIKHDATMGATLIRKTRKATAQVVENSFSEFSTALSLAAKNEGLEDRLIDGSPTDLSLRNIMSTSEAWAAAYILRPSGEIWVSYVRDKANNLTAGRSLRTRPFYSEIIRDKGGDVAISPSAWSPSYTDDVFVGLGVGIYNSVTHELLGILGGDIDLSILEETKVFTSKIRGGFAAVVDHTDVTAMHPQKEFVLKPIPNHVKAILKGGGKNEKNLSGMQEFVRPGSGEKMLLAYERIPVGKFNWTAVVIFRKAHVNAFANKVILLFCVFGIAYALLMVLSITLVVRSLIIARVGTLEKAFMQAAQKDLTASVVFAQRDEIARAGSHFNLFLDNTSHLIQRVNNGMELLNTAGGSLASTVGQAYSTIHTISSNVNSTKKEIEEHDKHVDQTASAVNQIAKSIESLQHSISDQAANIEESSAAIEEMMANIQSLNTIVDNSSEEMNRLENSSSEGFEQQKELIEQIRSVAKNSQSLQEANTLIGGIASQTNLLSMNAAIEAAHAGESGKGFAVVAGEIRKLAEEAAVQSDNIKKIINLVLGSIDKAVLLADTSGHSFELIREGIKSLNMVLSEIKHNMAEQAVGSKEGLGSLVQMKSITAEVKRGSDEITDSNKLNVQTVTDLARISKKIVTEMDEVQAGLQHFQDAMDAVRGLTDRNKNDIQKVLDLTSTFRTSQEDAPVPEEGYDLAQEEEPVAPVTAEGGETTD